MTDLPQPIAGLAGIVLAAGGSTRLGQPKQLLEFQAQTLIGRAVAHAEAICADGVTVVTGANAQAVRESMLGSAARVVNNPDWQQGMASSLRTAVASLDSCAGEAVLLMVCDQPKVTLTHLAALAELWQNSPAQPVAAFYKGALGVPAIMPRSWFVRLAELQGDQGARSLLRGDAHVRPYDLPEAAIDIDVPDDLKHLGHAPDTL